MIEVCVGDSHLTTYLLGRGRDAFSSKQIEKGFGVLYDRCRVPSKDKCRLESFGYGFDGKKCLECSFMWNGVVSL